MHKVTGKIIVAIGFAVVVYIVLTIWSSVSELIESLRGFHVVAFFVTLFLSLGNYALRFLKWQYYLRILDIRIPWWDSLLIFFSGFSMAITPGKVGEVLKAFLLKRSFHIPITRTATIIFVDRVTDLIAYLCIATATATSFQYGNQTLAILAAGTAVFIALMLWRSFAEMLFGFLEGFTFLKKHIHHLRTIYESSRSMMRPKQLAYALSMSVIAWLLECIALAVILFGLENSFDIVAAIFIYAFSAIVGAVSLLPGGLGSTEATMATLLISEQASIGTSAAATLLVRAGTLWFAVILGILALFLVNHRYHQQQKG